MDPPRNGKVGSCIKNSRKSGGFAKIHAGGRGVGTEDFQALSWSFYFLVDFFTPFAKIHAEYTLELLTSSRGGGRDGGFPGSLRHFSSQAPTHDFYTIFYQPPSPGQPL